MSLPTPLATLCRISQSASSVSIDEGLACPCTEQQSVKDLGLMMA